MIRAKPMTRKEAESLGLTKYSTGKPCRKGHNSMRRTCSGGCIECLKGYSADYRAAHKKIDVLVTVTHQDDAAVIRAMADKLNSERAVKYDPRSMTG